MARIPPVVDRSAPLRFVVNGRAGDTATDTKRDAIRAVLDARGRAGEILVCPPDAVDDTARDAAARAVRECGAIVGVGGDGTLNTVARAAHAAGCAMGVIGQGTFNYFVRSHGLPLDLEGAVGAVIDGCVAPERVAAVNDRLFLVNASLGLYPHLLEDREAWKARFGRSRVVAIGAGIATLLRARRSLRIRIELGAAVRDVKTLTLFVGHNRLQLAQVGLAPDATAERGATMTAVMLRPIGPLALLGLALRGAMGTLGDADGVERFDSDRMTVTVARSGGHGRVKVACDGEVAAMRSPLEFRVLDEPLWLLLPPGSAGVDRAADAA
jgi:diacylglycerol kinase family enzyme